MEELFQLIEKRYDLTAFRGIPNHRDALRSNQPQPPQAATPVFVIRASVREVRSVITVGTQQVEQAEESSEKAEGRSEQAAYSQQPTANSQQPIANSQPPTANNQPPLRYRLC